MDCAGLGPFATESDWTSGTISPWILATEQAWLPGSAWRSILAFVVVPHVGMASGPRICMGATAMRPGPLGLAKPPLAPLADSAQIGAHPLVIGGQLGRISRWWAQYFLVMAVRLLVVRTLEAPSWGDSVQHAVIARLINDHGGLFSSWEPYAPYRTLTVQFGFSVAAALLSWVTRIETAKATLLTGQLLNGLAILALYPLSRRIAGGNRWAGIGTIIVAGLLMPMPAFYVNWGRYAQLAGQVVLPIAIWLLWDFLEPKRLSWPAYGLASLSLAGLALNYYRMPFYYAAFVLAWLLLWALPRWRTDLRRWGIGMARLAMVAGGALLLLLPWALQCSQRLPFCGVGGWGRSPGALGGRPC